MHDASPELSFQSCSIYALLLICQTTLQRTGFGDVRIANRMAALAGESEEPHYLICHATVGTLPIKIVVAVVDRPVSADDVIHLNLAVVREFAEAGLVVTPHEITAEAAEELQIVRRPRIEVLANATFAEFLKRYRVGYKDGQVDYEFLEELEELAPKVISFLNEHPYAP